jgi:hypothetical protein
MPCCFGEEKKPKKKLFLSTEESNGKKKATSHTPATQSTSGTMLDRRLCLADPGHRWQGQRPGVLIG